MKNGKVLKNSIFEVENGFTTKEEWENNYMLIREEAIKRKVRYPIILASIETKIAYVFEGRPKPSPPVFDGPVYA